jgi:hypothetical protein
MENKHIQQVDFSNPNADKIISGISNKSTENGKTSMQELFDNLEAIDLKVPIGVKSIFLEKEKEQIINTFKDAQVLHAMNDQMRDEQYYNDTYGK